ncbi:uncharacterized protein LOC118240904, partial [Electrophorus electricus]|uniref:uncharacterized protein LOC118240904 n=1 Tax=Electrophorus electricus TaxID=8005 RepID=UPI0015D09FB5
MTIRTVSKSDEGVYYCKHPERGESPHSWVSVRDLPTTTLTVEPQSPVFTGESVTLKCEVQGYDAWTYQWYKKKAQSQWTTVSQSVFDTVNRETLTISGDAVVNGDQYQCRGERHDRPTTSKSSNIVTLTVHAGDSSSLGLVGLTVGLSLVMFFILLTLLWCYKTNKDLRSAAESLCRCTGSQSDINQTSDQTQRESEEAAHIYDTAEPADRSGTDEPADDFSDVTYAQVMKHNKKSRNKDTGAGPSEVIYAEVELKPKQKAKK